MKRTLNLPGSNVTSTFTSRTFTIVFLAVLWLLGGCGLLNDDDPDGGFSLGPPVYPSAYEDPAAGPDGEIIVFRRTKITRLDPGSGAYQFDPDSTGIWMIRADGTGMRFLMRGVDLYTPMLSPDGKWLAYVKGAQIFKVPFDGHAVDSSGVVQLTREGRNFSPEWSPGGEWIAYRRSYAAPEPPSVQGVWIMHTQSGELIQVYSGNSGGPTWHRSGSHIAFFRGVIDSFGRVLGDSLWVYALNDNRLETIAFLPGDNRHPKYSRDGRQIAFQSQAKGEGPEVWVMQSDGTHPRQLTGYGGRYPSWTPEGRIVYVHHNYWRFDEANGTIWIMNADGGGRRQLTFNHGLELR